MSNDDDIAMDFGDDDDGDEFLTGKLAALGIDEDLELSGGEEENEDPSPTAAAVPRPSSPSDPTSTTSSPSPSASAGGAAAGGASEGDDRKPDSKAAPIENVSPLSLCEQPSEAVAADDAQRPLVDERGGGRGRGGGEGGGGEGGGKGEQLEDGELLGMIEGPLKASRGRPQRQRPRQRRDGGKIGREGGRKAGGSRNNKGGRPQNNGRAQGRNVTVRECARWVCERLGEPKYYLMCQVVWNIGYKKTNALLEKVQETQDAGGMPTADGSRKRTAGGVFFTLLKQHMEPAKLKELYADEIRVKKEKDRARRAELKRKAAAALAGEDVMTPRDPPRSRSRGSSGGEGSTTRARRDTGTWARTDGVVGSRVGADSIASRRELANA